MPARLLAASDWFNDALINGMEARGWPRLSRSQSLIFVSIDQAGTRPAELARRLGMTRQSMQQLLAKLRDEALVTLEVDPTDGRAMTVRLAPRAHALGRDAAAITAEIERELASRIGEEPLQSLREILALDWGAPPC